MVEVHAVKHKVKAALSGEDNEAWWKKLQEEHDKLVNFGAIKQVKMSEIGDEEKIVGSMTILTEDIEKGKKKARIVVLGNQQDKEDGQSSSTVVSYSALRTIISLAGHVWGDSCYIRQVDVTTAFLQAEEDEDEKKRTLVRPPKEVY